MSESEKKNAAVFAAMTHQQKVAAVVQIIRHTLQQMTSAGGSPCLPSMLTGIECGLMMAGLGLSASVIKEGVTKLSDFFELRYDPISRAAIQVPRDDETN